VAEPIKPDPTDVNNWDYESIITNTNNMPQMPESRYSTYLCRIR